MEKYRKMLRQALTTDLSHARIAAQRGVSHHTVRRWSDIAKEKALTVAELDAMSHKDLRMMFKPASAGSSRLIIPDWSHEAQLVRSGHNRLETHAAYVERVGPDCALAYRTYCEKLRDYVRTLHPVLRLEHVPGHEMQTDFAGYRVPGREHGSEGRVYFKLFVAVLPFSNLLHASLVRSERVNDHIEANIAALEYFGGAPVLARPDNLKAAVVSRPRYGAPKLQAEYEAFLDHYGMGAEPARPRRPQDKAAVENTVKIVQRLLRLRVVQRPLLPLGEIQIILSSIVDTLNAKELRRAGGHSRRTLFEAEERAHLRELPTKRFQPYDAMQTRHIHKDYHIEFQGNYYSVPHGLIGRSGNVRANKSTVEIIVDGLTVALHPRSHLSGQTITDPKHRPENHAAYCDMDLLKWAEKYGQACVDLAQAELAAIHNDRTRKAREKWITSIPRRFGKSRFRRACERAVKIHDLRFEHVENVLKRGIENTIADQSENNAIKPRKNVRGSDYYRDGGKG